MAIFIYLFSSKQILASGTNFSFINYFEKTDGAEYFKF